MAAAEDGDMCSYNMYMYIHRSTECCAYVHMGAENNNDNQNLEAGSGNQKICAQRAAWSVGSAGEQVRFFSQAQEQCQASRAMLSRLEL